MAKKSKNSMLVIAPNDSMMYPATGYSHPVYEIQNGMMQNGGEWWDERPAYRGNAWNLPDIPVSARGRYSWDKVSPPSINGEGILINTNPSINWQNEHVIPNQPDWQNVIYKGRNIPLAPPDDHSINTVTKAEYLGTSYKNGGPWGDPNTLLRFIQSGPGHQEMEMGGYPYRPGQLVNTRITSINNIRHQPYPEGHSNPQNGYNTYANGGQFLPEPLEYALLANGGYIDKYAHGGIPVYEDGGEMEMKKGGIYIKPSKRGTFTAAAKKHGKGVQEFASQVLAHKENYSPAMVKKANFAHNAAGWKHQYGGEIDNDGDIDEMKSGGWIQHAIKHPGRCSNPGDSRCPKGSPQYNLAMRFKHGDLHKKQYGGLQKFTDGGITWSGSNPSQEQQDDNPNRPSGVENQVFNPPTNPNQTGVVTSDIGYRAPEAWRQGMTDQQAQQELQTAVDNHNGPVYQRSGTNLATGASNLLGAGLMTASYFENQNAQKQLQSYRQNRGLSGNAFSSQKMYQEGSKGDYDQNGNFRPSQYVPTRPGIQYAPVGQYGGQYAIGGEYEMDDKTIQDLQRRGYKLKFI